MGASGPVLPALPDPDTGPIDPILARWKRRDPGLHNWAMLLISWVAASVRDWIDPPGDGIGVEFKATNFGLGVEGIYGWYCGTERLILTKLLVPSTDTPMHSYSLPGYVAFNPDGSIERLALRRRRDTLNIWHPLDDRPAGDDGIGAAALPTSGAAPDRTPPADPTRTTLRDHAPPWLPRMYLRAHVPRCRKAQWPGPPAADGGHPVEPFVS